MLTVLQLSAAILENDKEKETPTQAKIAEKVVIGK
jgi:hypothetical protein